MASTGEAFGLFWDSENGDRTYSAASFEYWLKKFFTSGVFNGDLQVKATSGMTLEVEAGYTNADGKVKFWNAPFNVTLDAANSTYPRIDTVVIRRDNVNRQITCEKVTGAYSGDTPQPTAPTRNSEIFELVIAQIYVGAGVTGITQSNITDTRPNNELCGYITGTVEELDFSAFTAQFEAYFAEFKRNQMADFQAWEVAQQAAYAAWFNLVKQQQIQDKADWDAWYAALQEELHELPADTAEYLQIEIDEIRTSGTTGSILKISTTETSLEGKTVTVTNGTETRTATFDENLECLIAGYKGTGEVTISSSDGIQTATTVVTIPYFGNYTYNIAFWAATVNIQGDDNLKGATITVKDSDNQTVGTVVLNVITGRGVFTAQKADTYTFNFTYQGTAYSESLVVDEETTYSLSLSAGFSWQTWVDTARFLDSTDYNSLNEVLADEKAIRELCLEHACVDYMAEIATASADVETIINTDLFAKWVNNSDYALDYLYANEIIADYMDDADKYFYGEWVITDNTTTPPTWEPKGNVPVMTSSTAPYGTASASEDATESYKAFDGDSSTYWATSSTTNQSISYTFTNPVCVKKVKIGPLFGTSSSTCRVKNFKIEGLSPTSGSWVTLYTGIWNDFTNAEKVFEITNDDYYMAYHLLVIDTYAGGPAILTLQFYGRELSVSVPVMTGNTTPYGEASSSSNSYPAYKAFDGKNNADDAWRVDNNTENYLLYNFEKAVVARYFEFVNPDDRSNDTVSNFDVIASNDGTNFTVIKSFSNIPSATIYNESLDNNVPYKYYGIKAKGANNTYNSSFRCSILQFYGLDYSEKEFESETTKKWLYDHGVELETLDWVTEGSGVTMTKEDSQIVLNDASTSYAGILFVDSNGITTDYSLLRLKVGNEDVFNEAAMAVDDSKSITANTLGVLSITSNNAPNNFALDVSNINSGYVGINAAGRSSTGKVSISEWWLE